VTVDMVIEILNRNTQVAQQAVRNLVRSLSEERTCACSSALATALITNKEAIPGETRQRLGLLVDKYLA
jgi:5'-methylthioadenosine phosphorylase